MVALVVLDWVVFWECVVPAGCGSRRSDRSPSCWRAHVYE